MDHSFPNSTRRRTKTLSKPNADITNLFIAPNTNGSSENLSIDANKVTGN